jgi:hypothetical protein
MFFTITSGDITTMTGYITGLVGDFMPLILIVVGISIAMYIFNRITK